MKYREFFLCTIVFINSGILTSCSVLQQAQLFPATDSSFYTIDLGKEKKTNGRIFIKININPNPSFNAKSTSGAAAKTKSDLSHLKLYLVESNTGSFTTGTIIMVPG